MTVTTDLSAPEQPDSAPARPSQPPHQGARRHPEPHLPLRAHHRRGRRLRVLRPAVGVGLGHARRPARVRLHHRVAHRARWRSGSRSSTGPTRSSTSRRPTSARCPRASACRSITARAVVVLDRGAGRAGRGGGARLVRRVRDHPPLLQGAAPDPDGRHGRPRAAARRARRRHPVLHGRRLSPQQTYTRRSTSASRSARSSSTPTS